ncbi:MAG: ribosome maturation factor RimM [Gammaproteobacteria bacterium]|nr:MAG: ribosome maturation factor RimM [Gammaproteobacteria bacterium]
MHPQDDESICVGHVIGVQGVKGWVKVFSDTSPRENILNYSPWIIQTGEDTMTAAVSGRRQGRNVIAQLAGIEDRDLAAELIGSKIYIEPGQLPKLKEGEYYWADLIGMAVESLESEPLGTVETMMETGANDVMVLQGDRERLIPFVIDEIVQEIDLVNKRVVVDWKPDY